MERMISAQEFREVRVPIIKEFMQGLVEDLEREKRAIEESAMYEEPFINGIQQTTEPTELKSAFRRQIRSNIRPKKAKELKPAYKDIYITELMTSVGDQCMEGRLFQDKYITVWRDGTPYKVATSDLKQMLSTMAGKGMCLTEAYRCGDVTAWVIMFSFNEEQQLRDAVA